MVQKEAEREVGPDHKVFVVHSGFFLSVLDFFFLYLETMEAISYHESYHDQASILKSPLRISVGKGQKWGGRKDTD